MATVNTMATATEFVTNATTANKTESCGKWTLQIIAMDPIVMPTATAGVSDGLLAVFKGGTTVACTAEKSCAGFCVRNKASATTERSVCMSPTVLAAAANTNTGIQSANAAQTYLILVTKTVFDSTDKALNKDGSANIEWIDKKYGGEDNIERTADAALKNLQINSAVSFLRFAYWVPKTAGAAAGIPPRLDQGMTVTTKCVEGKKTNGAGEPFLIASTSADKLIGTASKPVTVGGPAGSYKAAAGSIVLTRPTGFAQAATATTAIANMPTGAFDAELTTTDVACQGSWLKIFAVTAATWATDTKADTSLATYTMGMKAMLTIRLSRAYGGAAKTGYANNTTMALCVTLKAAAGLPHGATADTTPTAVCFYTASQAVSARNPVTDANSNGFKTLNVDAYQTVNLVKPATVVLDGVVGTAAAGLAASADNLLVSATANATTYKMLKLAMTGPGKNTDCLGSWMGAGTCKVTATWYLPKTAKTVSKPFLPQDGDKITSHCVKASNFKAGTGQDSVAVTGASNAAAPGNPNNAAKTVSAAPTATVGFASHALLTGTATSPLTAALEVAGLTSANLATIITAVTAAAAYTDGYELTSRLSMTADNAGAGTLVGACYACDGTTCTDNSGYCHQVSIQTGLPLNIAMNTHKVVVVSKAEMAKGKATVTGAAPVTGVFPGSGTTTYTLAGALLKILAPVASTGAWAAATAPKTLGCLGCLAKVPATAVVGQETRGMMVARWYQPTQGTETTTSGPRFNTGENVTAWGMTSNGTVVKGTATAVKKGALSLAAAFAGVAAGAAALAM